MLVLWIICALLTGAIASGNGKSFGAGGGPGGVLAGARAGESNESI